MATGRGNRLTGQVGEFLVCAELGRRDLIATPFAGNVPGFDVVAIDESQTPVPIQVKTSNGGDWQFDSSQYLDIHFDEATGIQTVRGRRHIANPDLIHVFVWLGHRRKADDRFFVLTLSQLQDAIMLAHSTFLGKHGGRRPRKPDSFHVAIRLAHIEQHEDNWVLIEKRLQATARQR